MEDHMYRLISFFWRLLLGDPYDKARHRFNRPDAVRFVTASGSNNPPWPARPRHGWRYRTPDHRWMSSTALLRQVRERDLHTITQPMRWWQQEQDDPGMQMMRKDVQVLAQWHQGDLAGRMA